jgi:hypothetical protein
MQLMLKRSSTASPISGEAAAPAGFDLRYKKKKKMRD